MDKLRYFIVPVVFSTSGDHEPIDNLCRVVGDDYRELFNFVLNLKDTELFIKIMKSDKDALLNRTHEILGELSYWKIDFCQGQVIQDGLVYP